MTRPHQLHIPLTNETTGASPDRSSSVGVSGSQYYSGQNETHPPCSAEVKEFKGLLGVQILSQDRTSPIAL